MIESDNPTEIEELRRAINDRVLRSVDDEKAKAVVRQAEIARVLEKTGSLRSEGLGQRIGAIDSRVFFRWWQQYRGCWQNEEFIKEFLRDNAQCRAPGYHGPTGKPVYFTPLAT